MTDSLSAFDKIASSYRDHRPSYPEELFAHLARAVPDRGFAIDVGAGTGISTRQLAVALGMGWRIEGLEPGTGMRDHSGNDALENVLFRSGQAELLPYETSSVDLILVAQALQWFDRPRFYAEAQRVLKAGGVLAVIQNNRSWQHSDFLADYESLLETHNKGYDRNYRSFDICAELNANGFQECTRQESRWLRQMTPEGFVGMAFSSTKYDAVVKSLGREPSRQLILQLAGLHFPDGTVQVPYESELFLARNQK